MISEKFTFFLLRCSCQYYPFAHKAISVLLFVVVLLVYVKRQIIVFQNLKHLISFQIVYLFVCQRARAQDNNCKTFQQFFNCFQPTEVPRTANHCCSCLEQFKRDLKIIVVTPFCYAVRNKKTKRKNKTAMGKRVKKTNDMCTLGD